MPVGVDGVSANSGGSASIASYSTSTFDSSTPDVVGALDPNANKSASSFVQRTFVGVKDDDGNGTPETVFLFSSAYSNQAGANTVLKSFGASSVAMLDFPAPDRPVNQITAPLCALRFSR